MDTIKGYAKVNENHNAIKNFPLSTLNQTSRMQCMGDGGSARSKTILIGSQVFVNLRYPIENQFNCNLVCNRLKGLQVLKF